MNMKKALTVAGAMVFVTAGATTLASCGKSDIDTTKTQLYVLNYQGGYGKKWLENAARRYEEMYKDRSFQPGKTGLEIIVQEEKQRPNNAVLKNSNYELICFEGLVYKDLMADNMCADITKYVTNPNPYETEKTIESKMYEEQKDFFKDNGKYYVLPNYVGTFGVVYNKKVFDQNGLYFVDGYESLEGDERFTIVPEERSAGPDGAYNTEDDGLPVTYEDFYDLCSYIDSRTLVPLIWMGKNSQNYLTDLTSAMIANYDGYENYKANYLMDGTFEAAKIDDANGTVKFNADGSIETEMVTVHPGKVGNAYDGYEIQRSASKYYAFDFIKNIVHNKGQWAYDRLNDSLLHTDAQSLFINSQFGVLPSFKKPNAQIAMLFEGNWWESEASEVFEGLSQDEKSQLDYGWMPLPRNVHSTNNKNTSISSLTSYMFVKNGLEDYQTELAADFMQYLNTDAAYEEFSVLTSAVKSFKYELSAESKAKMTKCGQHFWDYFQESEKIFPQSHNGQFTDALSSFELSRRYFTKETMTWPSLNFATDPNETAGTYMNKMYHYYKDTIWSKLQ
ncbi:MAG: hypothetical protein MJ239_02210 [Bacilli bacterium]|nr:hypothetical protein [Bacilli bacterium]